MQLRSNHDGLAVHELTTPSVTSQNLREKTRRRTAHESASFNEAVQSDIEAVGWCDLSTHGYVHIVVTPDKVVSSWFCVPDVTSTSAELSQLRKSVIRGVNDSE